MTEFDIISECLQHGTELKCYICLTHVGVFDAPAGDGPDIFICTKCADKQRGRERTSELLRKGYVDD